MQNTVFGCIELEKPVLSSILLPVYFVLDTLWVCNTKKFGIISEQVDIIIHMIEDAIDVHQEKVLA